MKERPTYHSYSCLVSMLGVYASIQGGIAELDGERRNKETLPYPSLRVVRTKYLCSKFSGFLEISCLTVEKQRSKRAPYDQPVERSSWFSGSEVLRLEGRRVHPGRQLQKLDLLIGNQAKVRVLLLPKYRAWIQLLLSAAAGTIHELCAGV